MCFPCGKCMPCLVSRRIQWTTRMMLESMLYDSSSFVTLTYNKENCPVELKHKDLTDFLKRLRHVVGKFRYFAVGEYGDESHRPHYHMAVFGIGPQVLAGPEGVGSPLDTTWGKGYVYAGDLTWDSARYIAGYVTKKLTDKDDVALNGKVPEFARMSLKPGIGAKAMKVIADSIGDEHLHSALVNGDVPAYVKQGIKKLNLGRYLKGVLREEVGMGTRKVPSWALAKFSSEMCRLYGDAYRASPDSASKSPRQVIVDYHNQKVLNLESRLRVKKQEKKI